MNKALSAADVLISTGGVSMGEKDWLAEVLLQDLNAELHFGRINMKPGYFKFILYLFHIKSKVNSNWIENYNINFRRKPTKFFSVSQLKETKFVFGLPGNPVSAAVTFHLFVLPALRRMSNIEPVLPKLIKVMVCKCINKMISKEREE